MAKRRSVTVDFEADTSGAIKGFRAVSKESGKTGASIQKFSKGAKLALGGVAAGSVAALGAEMAKRGAQIESILTRTETVFGDNADSVKRWADENNEAFGVSEAGLLDMANAIQDVLVPLGFMRDEAEKMTMESLEVANALSEWTGGAKTAKDASEAIGKALLGERERLKEFGVALLESDISARLAAKGLAHLTGEAKAQAKAQVSLELIMEKSTDAIDAYREGGNDALRDQKKLAAQIADLKDQASRMAADIGAKVIPIMSDFFEMFGTPTQDDIDALARKLAEVGDLSFDDVVTSIGDMVPKLEAVGINVDEVADKVLLGEDAWNQYVTEVLEAGRATGASKKDIIEAAVALDELRSESEQARVAAIQYRWEIQDTARDLITQSIAAGEAALATREGASATRDHTAALAEQANPLLNAWSNLDRLREAQAKLNQLAPGTAEYEDAVLDVVEAQLKLNGALGKLDDEAGAMAAITSAANQAGVKDAAAAVRELNEGLDRYNRWTPADKQINIRVVTSATGPQASYTDIWNAIIAGTAAGDLMLD